MKKNILIIAIVFWGISTAIAQNVVELDYNVLAKDFIELKEMLKETEDQESIELCIKALSRFEDVSTRYNLIYWELSFLYSNLKQYDKCFEILKRGQKEDMFYFLRRGERAFPSYMNEIEKLDGFEAFWEKNNALKDAANKNSKTEFMVQLPKNYKQSEKYPLMIILHGGIGSISSMQHKYISEKLKNDFIVAYFQGSRVSGSNARSFIMRGWQERILDGYKQINSKYSIDTSKIILGGPSAGGFRSLVIGVRDSIPTTGLLLSFAVYPFELDSTNYINSSKRGLKVALLCGENDWAIKQQKKLGYILDKYEVQNRFVVFPEEGHDFPKNWVYYLESSIDYLFKEEE